MSSNINLIDSFQEFKEFKNIDRPTVISVLEEVFRSMIRRRFGTDENCDVIVNPDNGDLEIWRTRVVVEDEFSEDDDLEIELTEAKKFDADLEVGDDYIEQITLESFGRRAILAARQTLVSKVLELEKDEVFKKYKDREGELVIGEVYQIWKKELLVLDDDGNELILPKTEQIPADYFKKGDSIRAVVYKVDMMNNNPKILISRTAPEFLQRLFELEVPEIFDGLITIKKIVREPGERAKVAVESYDDRIDPVGACVGMKGSRIHGIVRELRNENIDVINFTTNHSLYITRALSPARISSIKIDEENKTAAVYLKSDQVSLAIGRGGHNIKLAGKLTGYEIDVYRENDEFDEDVDIEEFSDEIESWVIDALKRVGLDSARSVLALTEEELSRRTDLEEDTVKDILRILQAEFE
ncbi:MULTISPECIES: transcription termination factor NusA [Sphingobacterium]|jgi:N utilization substance protein A|uniref:Transcription termination/antitermination protein NusA n=2 Tax=Sphingobacterium TaxID=28453 RepID=A0ABW5YQG8_9SPHI|nr:MULTISPECIES: transcription termination factor NusA [Sphingobacterium]MBO6201769.1 transcription termination/antitermination protein NusA [Chryseobacterium sp.]KKX50990.1 transcription elongation factor NusA [Sphingobacterium sp. IITKGP-BTPF85]MBB2951744.1 N utilization substance protein A [Sphingobacterium sp. JUb56]MCS3557193.1 N utilization substance protein A [Sphingobacterium sp. JUb21]MCW2260259.1 N utilization substance protein A [Sphingobacterium kitahiroshimense]